MKKSLLVGLLALVASAATVANAQTEIKLSIESMTLNKAAYVPGDVIEVKAVLRSNYPVGKIEGCSANLKSPSSYVFVENCQNKVLDNLRTEVQMSYTLPLDLESGEYSINPILRYKRIGEEWSSNSSTEARPLVVRNARLNGELVQMAFEDEAGNPLKGPITENQSFVVVAYLAGVRMEDVNDAQIIVKGPWAHGLEAFNPDGTMQWVCTDVQELEASVPGWRSAAMLTLEWKEELLRVSYKVDNARNMTNTCVPLTSLRLDRFELRLNALTHVRWSAASPVEIQIKN